MFIFNKIECLIELSQWQLDFAPVFIEFLDQSRNQFFYCDNFVVPPYIAASKSVTVFEITF